MGTMEDMGRHLSRFREGAGPFMSAGPALVPTLAEVESFLRSVGRRPMPGLGGLPADLHTGVPDALARAFHPLLVKLGVRYQAPVAFNGGRAAELYKGRGRIPDCGSYREVLVPNKASKCWHRCLRRRLSPVADAFALDVVSCRRHHGTDIGARGPRASQDWAQAQRLWRWRRRAMAAVAAAAPLVPSSRRASKAPWPTRPRRGPQRSMRQPCFWAAAASLAPSWRRTKGRRPTPGRKAWRRQPGGRPTFGSRGSPPRAIPPTGRPEGIGPSWRDLGRPRSGSWSSTEGVRGEGRVPKGSPSRPGRRRRGDRGRRGAWRPEVLDRFAPAKKRGPRESEREH